MTSSMTIAVDLAKTVFEIAIANSDWRIVDRHRLSRSQFQQSFFNRQCTTVVMEACGTAHFWGRWLTGLGVTVRLIPAHYARPYRRRNKNDAADAAALVEAARSAEIIDVPLKSTEQQAIQETACYAEIYNGEDDGYGNANDCRARLLGRESNKTCRPGWRISRF